MRIVFWGAPLSRRREGMCTRRYMRSLRWVSPASSGRLPLHYSSGCPLRRLGAPHYASSSRHDFVALLVLHSSLPAIVLSVFYTFCVSSSACRFSFGPTRESIYIGGPTREHFAFTFIVECRRSGRARSLHTRGSISAIYARLTLPSWTTFCESLVNTTT